MFPSGWELNKKQRHVCRTLPTPPRTMKLMMNKNIDDLILNDTEAQICVELQKHSEFIDSGVHALSICRFIDSSYGDIFQLLVKYNKLLGNPVSQKAVKWFANYLLSMNQTILNESNCAYSWNVAESRVDSVYYCRMLVGDHTYEEHRLRVERLVYSHHDFWDCKVSRIDWDWVETYNKLNTDGNSVHRLSVIQDVVIPQMDINKGNIDLFFEQMCGSDPKPQMFKLFDKANKIIDGDIDEELKDKMADSGIDVIQKMFTKMLSGAEKSIISVSREILSTACIVGLCYKFSVVFTKMYNQEKVTSAEKWEIFVITAILLINEGVSIVGTISRIVSACKSSSKSAKPQMDASSLVGLLSSVLFSRSTFKMATGEHNLGLYMSQLSKIGRESTGITMLFQNITEFYHNMIRDKLVHMGFPSLNQSSGSSILDEFFEKFTQLENANKENKLYLNVENKIKIDKLISVADKILTTNIKVDSRFYTLVQQKNRLLMELSKKFSDANITNTGLRFETIGFMFFGKPKNYKSWLLKSFADDCVILTIEDKEELLAHFENDSNFQFNRISENKYWDSYKDGVKVVTVDEFGQSRDKGNLGGDNEEMNSIRMLNMFPCDLHMAHLDKKGNVDFRAKFVIATTNLTCLKAESLVSPGALRRRWFQINVQLKSEYRDNLPTNEFGNTYVKRDMFEFRWMKETGELCDEVFSYRDLISFAKETYLTRLAHYQVNQTSFKSNSLELYKELKEEGFYETVGDIHGRISDYSSNFMSDLREYLNKESVVDGDDDRERVMDLITPGSFPQSDCSDKPEKVIPKFKKKLEFKSRVELSTEIYYEQAQKYVDALSVEDYNILGDRIALMTNKSSLEFSMSVTGGEDLSDKEIICKILSHCLSLDDERYLAYVTEGAAYHKIRYGLPSVRLKYNLSVVGSIRDGVMKCFESALSGLYGFGKWFVEVFFDVKKWVEENPFIVMLASLSAIFGIYTVIFPDDENPADPQSLSGEHLKVKKASIKSRFAKPKSGVKDAESQLYDKQGMDMSDKIVNKNTIELFDTYKGKITARVLMIKGRIALIPFHYIYTYEVYIDDDVERSKDVLRFLSGGIEIFACTRGEMIDFVDLEKPDRYLDDMDTIFFSFPNSMRSFMDISQYFITEQLLSALTSFDVKFDVGYRNHKVITPAYLDLTRKPLKVDIFDSEYHINRYLKYHAQSEVGDCGTPVFVLLPSLGKHRIIGIHAAGNDVGAGYCPILYKEEVEHILSTFEDVVYSVQPQLMVFDTPKNANVIEGMKIYGKTKCVHKMGTKHSKIPSVLQEHFEPTCALTVVTPTRGISPLSLALTKYKNKNLLVLSEDEQKAFKMAECSLRDLHSRHSTRYTGSSVVSLESAIWGTEGDEYYKGLKHSSSVGVVYNYTYPELKKELYSDFGLRNKQTKAYKHLEEQTNELVRQMLTGQRIEHYYSANLKLEKLPKEKVEQLKARFFTGCGMDYALLCKMYFGHFMASVLKNVYNNECCLKTNDKSMDWNRLYRDMHTFQSLNAEVGAGDYAGYDSCMESKVALSLYEVIKDYYGNSDPEANKVRFVLFHEILYPVIIFGDCVFEYTHGMPSGNPLTSFVNCLLNSFIFRFSYFLCCIKNQIKPGSFTQNVVLRVNGDDNIFTVHESKKLYFNEMTMGLYCKSLNFVYTSDTKVASVKPFRPIEEVEFLKRSFRFEKYLGHVVGPMRWSAMVETMLWTDKKQPETVLIANINNVLREAALHGKPKWSGLKGEIYSTLKKVQLNIIPHIDDLSWSETLDSIYGDN